MNPAVELVEIGRSGDLVDATLARPAILESVVEATLEHYSTVGHQVPWVSYAGVVDGIVVGTAGLRCLL